MRNLSCTPKSKELKMNPVVKLVLSIIAGLAVIVPLVIVGITFGSWIYATIKKKLKGAESENNMVTATKCGHRTKLIGEMSAFGVKESGELVARNGTVPWCWECLSQMAIQCAWCGKPIFVARPVTLYSPIKSFEIPTYAVVHSKEPLKLIGCGRMSCTSVGDFGQGFWEAGEDGKGRIKEVNVFSHILDKEERTSLPSAL